MGERETTRRIGGDGARPNREQIRRDRVARSTGPLQLSHRVGARIAVALFLCGVAAGGGGCVRRTVTITTEPSNALVLLNDQEIGRSAVSTDFLWYGDYDVVIRKEGYKTLATNWKIDPPWYQYIPIDFFAEVLWPGWIHDQRSRHFVLEPAEAPTADQLLERASEARERALDPRRDPQ